MKGGGDSAYLADLATYVDARMNQIADATATVDSLKVAILTALNIADEYHQLKRESEKPHGSRRARGGMGADAGWRVEGLTRCGSPAYNRLRIVPLLGS